MSYSFSIRAATKAEAKEMVTAEMAKVLQYQPIHSTDQAQAEAAAAAFIDLMPDDDTKDLSVSVHDSVGWSGSQEAPIITNASVGVSVSHMGRSTG